VVVLGDDEHESVVGGHRRRPGPRVGVPVVVAAGSGSSSTGRS
jgi:hypothetical protein